MNATDKIEDLFYYDESSESCLRWKVNRYGGRGYKALIIQAGTAAGSRGEYRGQKKWRTIVNKRLMFCHNIVWKLHHGDIPESFIVDHIDGNTENNSIGNLRVVTRTVNNRNASVRKDNASGKNGVCLISSGKGFLYWTSTWYNADGVEERNRFPVHKLGNDEAFRLACEHRDEMITKLNSAGAGYTHRHGQHKENRMVSDGT